MNEEDLKAILQRLALLEQKTRGIHTLTLEEEEALRKKRNGDGGNVYLSGGKGDRKNYPNARDGQNYPNARDGQIYLKEAGGSSSGRVVVFNFDTCSFEPSDDPEASNEG